MQVISIEQKLKWQPNCFEYKHYIISLAWYLHKMISPLTSWKKLSALKKQLKYFWSYEAQASKTTPSWEESACPYEVNYLSKEAKWW